MERIQQFAGISLLIALIAAGASFVGSGRAQSLTYAPAPDTSAGMPMVLTVDGSGRALIRGTVVGTGAGSLMVRTWGGTWTLTRLSLVQIYPGVPGSESVSAPDFSQISLGDFVGAIGTVSTTQGMTINASIVRDWTRNNLLVNSGILPRTTSTGAAAASTIYFGTNIPAASTPLAVGDQLYTGVLTNLGNGTFLLTQTGTGARYQVYLTGGASIWNGARGNVYLSSFQNGDMVRLDGVLSGNTVTADVVRDISR